MHTTAGQTSELHPSTISELLISEVRQHRKGVALTAALAALALAAAAFGLYRLIESARRPGAFQTMRLAKLTRAGDVVEKMVAISPDGRLVACAYGEAKPDAQIKLAVIPSEGGPPVRLIEAPAAVKSLALRWSPDGCRIVYIDSRDRVSNLWEQPLDGGQPTRLTNFKTDQVFRFDWSRDGKRLALAQARRLRRSLNQQLARTVGRRDSAPCVLAITPWTFASTSTRKEDT